MRLDDAAAAMRGLGVHHLIVTSGGEVVGVLSDSDMAKAGSKPLADLHVGDVMSTHVATIDQNETVRRAANLMRGRKTGCLVVVDGERLCGVVTIADLLALLGKGTDRRGSGARASLHYRTRHTRQHGRPRW
jgi:acetoin utilization protein AcuB